MRTKIKFWVGGIIVAAIGLVLARVISSIYADHSAIQLTLFLIGVVFAMAGLGIILMGIRKPE
jgi:hypothetical protein